ANTQAAQDDVTLGEVHDAGAPGAGVRAPERDAGSGRGRAVDGGPPWHVEARREPDAAADREADRGTVAGRPGQRVAQGSRAGVREGRDGEDRASCPAGRPE